jgi:hypothetical protein
MSMLSLPLAFVPVILDRVLVVCLSLHPWQCQVAPAAQACRSHR